MLYDINIQVDYNDNIEYRQALRKAFKMNCIEDINNADMDEITRDELLYDENAISTCMTFILETTQHITIFKDLYLITAARMFSQDLGIGLSVLFSYDNFKLFHLVLIDYFKDPYNYTSSSNSYNNLYNHIK